ncbi:MAG: flagellar motor switch protein FliN [Ignavibacteriaceae bacterium]|jgi:flagellar motor switch protein FliN/FliY|nr:flagellar motor switch protein FliN [Ignavibacteriaceae bacterium]
MAENFNNEEFDDAGTEQNNSASLGEEDIFSGKQKNDTSSKNVDVADFEDFDEAFTQKNNANSKLDMLRDLHLNVYIELGRTQMLVKDILELERGYVIELDKLASEPVDIFVNNKKIAEGEVVVIDKHFGIRITNLNEHNKGLKGLS